MANGILKEGIPVPQFSNNIRPGDIKYKDVNNDGIINALDQSPIGGTWDPMLVYGFGLNIYKFQLRMPVPVYAVKIKLG